MVVKVFLTRDGNWAVEYCDDLTLCLDFFPTRKDALNGAANIMRRAAIREK